MNNIPRVLIAEAREMTTYNLRLGTSRPSDIASVYFRAGKYLHAAKFHLLSTHGLRLEDVSRMNLTERQLDYVVRSAEKLLENMPLEINASETYIHPIEQAIGVTSWSIEEDYKNSLANTKLWLADQVSFLKKKVYGETQ